MDILPATGIYTPSRDLPALALLLALELVVLRRGQRRLFWATSETSGSRLLAYALAMPGTVLHEAAHYLACLALGVPVGRALGPGTPGARVRLFWPRQEPNGDVVLGGVPHARTDPLRQALISTAPLLVVPPALALITALLLGPGALSQLPDVLGRVALWKALTWCYVAQSCAQAAFPSPGDRVGVVGALGLALLGALAVGLISVLGTRTTLADVLGAVVGMLALPAAAAVVLLVVLRAGCLARS